MRRQHPALSRRCTVGEADHRGTGARPISEWLALYPVGYRVLLTLLFRGCAAAKRRGSLCANGLEGTAEPRHTL